MTINEKAALLRNRINILEARGKSSQGLVNSLKRELANLERKAQ